MPILSTDSTDLYYEIYGEGFPIIFAHGVGGNHAIWHKQISVFSQSYQVITFDHRGFGNSSDPRTLGRSAFISDLKALIDYLQFEKVALVGQSMGGGTCVGFTCTYPEKVSVLVIADSLHGIKEPEVVKRIMDKARNETKTLDQIERVLGKQFRKEDPSAEILYRQISSFNMTDQRNLAGEYEKICTPEELDKTNVPVLLIAGSEDILFPIEAIREVKKLLNNAYIVEIQDSGHSAFFERPTEFNDSVLSMLQMAGIKGTSRLAHSNLPGYEKVS